jgi:hypothetical protein
MTDVKILEDIPETTELELIVINKTVGSLNTNISRLEELVNIRLEDYSPDKYTGDADSAKKDRAELNKAKDAIATSRRKIIDELMKPYSDFEERCKALEKKIDLASRALDEIVKQKESEEKEAKRQRIQLYWNSKNFDLFPIDRVFNQKWLNKTFKEADITREIDSVIDRTYKDLKTVEKYCELNELAESAEILKAHYLVSLDMTETLEYAEQLQKKKDLAEKEAVERSDREHREKLEKQFAETAKEAKKVESSKYVDELVAMSSGEPVEEKRKEYVISVKCTKDELVQLRCSLDAIGIEYSVQELDF